MNTQSLKRISTWGKVLGILTMISGGISTLSGLFAFVVGAIPGLVTVFMGYLLYKTGKEAQNYLETESDHAISELLENYGKYLFVNGILLLVVLALLVVLLLIGGLGAFALLGSM